MKKYLSASICALSLVAMAACGGGGGSGGTSAAPVTKAVTKVYLFGTMSSNSKIATVQTTMIVPLGVMVNYTAPVGATAGIYPLKKGVIVPSGPVQVSTADFSASTFNIATRALVVSLFNQGGVPLASNTLGNGAEIATINLNLTTPGVTAPMPLQDMLASVGQDRPGISLAYLTGCTVNFVTTFQ